MELNWPPNPGNNYIAMRAATQGDIASASAVFVIAGDAGTSLGEALDIGVPRAVFVGQGGNRTKATIVQAERSPTGAAMLGLLLPDGSTSVVTGPEVELADRCVGYFNDDDYTIDDFQKALVGGDSHVERSGDTIAYSFGDGPVLYITLQRGVGVQSEAAQIGEDSDYADALRQCNARIEVTFDDLDAVLDEINTLIFVQESIQVELNGVIYLSWNGEFIGPNG